MHKINITNIEGRGWTIVFLVMVFAFIVGIALLVISIPKIKTKKLYVIALVAGILLIAAAIYLALPK